ILKWELNGVVYLCILYLVESWSIGVLFFPVSKVRQQNHGNNIDDTKSFLSNHYLGHIQHPPVPILFPANFIIQGPQQILERSHPLPSSFIKPLKSTNLSPSTHVFAFLLPRPPPAFPPTTPPSLPTVTSHHSNPPTLSINPHNPHLNPPSSSRSSSPLSQLSSSLPTSSPTTLPFNCFTGARLSRPHPQHFCINSWSRNLHALQPGWEQRAKMVAGPGHWWNGWELVVG
ncbi:hypothetical protein EX30DRAFT_376035, partial [Ascodesmis nigricans]